MYTLDYSKPTSLPMEHFTITITLLQVLKQKMTTSIFINRHSHLYLNFSFR